MISWVRNMFHLPYLSMTWSLGVVDFFLLAALRYAILDKSC